MLSKLVLGFGAPPSRLLIEIHRMFQQENTALDYSYQPIVLESTYMERCYGILHSENILGCHFASPVQVAQAPWLDSIGSGAASSGWINVVYKDQQKLIGEDTQLSGSLKALQGAGFCIEGSRVLLVGSGYEAQSIVRSLALLGMKKLLLLHTSVDLVRSMASALKRDAPDLIVMIGSLLSENLGQLTAEVDLLINALPSGDEMNRLVTTANVSGRVLTFNLVANHSLVTLSANDTRTIDSTQLLLWRSIETLRLWNSQEPPIEALQKILENAENHSY